MAKKLTRPGPMLECGEVNPLNADYDRFLPDDITDEDLRFPLNRVFGKTRGMLAIARILRANSVEKMAQGITRRTLNQQDEQGLFEALVELAMASRVEIAELGDAIIRSKVSA
jgi:hypothetical protein